ncbi:MAG TPA: Asp-tRNA(Asn)/Glu-tRNA(Gln) amidotransferase subunit GatA [Gammaproteobacteria bacterium]|nr:Asp-tRNA(Asn)/Glu-tRNA(Gln) amidotransferase subunit GatA [Gammaproteobacteria bacterium]
MNDLHKLGAMQLGAAIGSGECSASEAVDACLRQIGRDNDKVNAFITVIAEEARANAQSVDAEIATEGQRGPLQGVPIAHKDLYYTEDVRTTAGSGVQEDFIPAFDATVVARLKDAGMIMLGKLNTHEFAYGPTNDTSHFGACRNPWNFDRVSGGSSGGSGASIGMRMLPAATGSDTGGSIRIPAACCGITGLKPTYGRIPRDGIFPLCWTMDHPGPMARSVEDIAALLQVMSGFNAKDASSSPLPVPDYQKLLNKEVSGLRIGIPHRHFFDQSEAEIDVLVHDALIEFEKMGARLIDVDIQYIERAAAAAMAIYLAESTAYHENQLEEDPALYSEQVRTFLELGNHVLAKDYIHAQRYRALLGQQLATLFAKVDILATPTLPIVAPKIGQSEVEIRGHAEGVFSALLRNTEPFNLAGVPALVVPCGLSKLMPVSLQLIGAAFDESRILAAGHAFQRVTDWHTKLPPYLREL